jgi:hypothetical protein
MNRTRSAWLSTALLCGALLAGCGGSSSTTTSTASSTPATTSTSAATAPSTTTPVAPTTSVPSSSAGRFAAAICKSTAARAKLPVTLKAQVDAICHDYEKGDTAKARVDAEKACTEAVEAIPNESPQKQQALARCKGK